MRLTSRQSGLLIAPLAFVLLVWLLGPTLLGFAASFTDYAPGHKAIQLIGLHNYVTVLGDKQFLIGLTNIGFFTLIAVPLELIIGFGLAYVLRRPFRGRHLWRVVLLIPWLISPIGNGVMWHYLFNSSTGILNFGMSWLQLPEQPSPLGQTSLAMLVTIGVEVWRTAPLAAFLLFPGLAAIPSEWWEQATLDGVPWPAQIANIALPAVRPLVLAVGLLLIGGALGTFDSVLILTGGGPGSATITPALYSYQQAFQINNWPIGATAAWFIVAAVIAIGACYVMLARREVV